LGVFSLGSAKRRKGAFPHIQLIYISGQNGRLTRQSAKGGRHSPIFKKLEKLRLLKILGPLTQMKKPSQCFLKLRRARCRVVALAATT
jgi:hypothetical protein